MEPARAPSTYNTGPTVRLMLGYNVVSLAKDLTAVSYSAADALGTLYANRCGSSPTGLDIINPGHPPTYLTQGSFVAPTTASRMRTGEGYFMYANFTTPLASR